MTSEFTDLSPTDLYEAGRSVALEEAQELIYAYCQRKIDILHSQGVHWMPTHPLAAHHRATAAQQVFQFLNLFDKKQEALGHESPWRRMSSEVSRPAILPGDRPPPTEAEIHELQHYGNVRHAAAKLYGKPPELMQREIAQLEQRVKDLEENQVIAHQKLAAYGTALDLVIEMMGRVEPGDSRAVSDEFVSIAAVRCGDHSSDMVAFVMNLIEKVKALPPPEYPGVKIIAHGEWGEWNSESGPPWDLDPEAMVDIDVGDGREYENMWAGIVDWSRVKRYRTRKVVS